MNKKQISNFLNSIIPGIKFYFEFGSTFLCQGSPAVVDYKCRILINKKYFSTFSELEQKGILMHEVGHILVGEYKSQVDSEYFAQVMAISLAKNNKWKKLYTELNRMFHEWAYDFKWNDKHGEFRRYILAGRRYYEQRTNDKTNKVRSRNA